MSSLEPTRPRASDSFYLGHGLGNDYLVVEEDPDGWRMGPDAVERVCARHVGVGSDGIVILLSPDAQPPFRVRIFNPDGGEVERSGNGLRVLASHLHRTGRVETGTRFRVRVGGDELTMTVHERTAAGRFDVSVGMGTARTGPGPVDAGAGRIDIEGGAPHGRIDHPVAGGLPVHLVSVGNPHAVVFEDALDGGADPSGGERGVRFDRASLERVGPGLSTHRAFGNGINVQLARVGTFATGPAGRRDQDDARFVDVLIWERGVGHTTASGTSACAVAVAAVESGRLPPGPVEIRMEGGRMEVSVTEGLDVVLRGPVQEVCTGVLAEGFGEGLGV